MAAKKTVKRTVTTRKATGSPKPTGPAAELMTLLQELDSDEITWLITQARTIIYNHKIEEANEAARELVDAKNRSTQKPKKSGKKDKAPTTIDIEQTGNGKSFVIVAGNARLFMNLGELKALVKISQSADNPADAAARLFRWMDRERRDMVIDADFSGPADARLAAVYGILKEKFTVG